MTGREITRPVNKSEKIRIASAFPGTSFGMGQTLMKARLPEAHRLIRNMDTGLYLSVTGNWVANEDDAFDFPDLRSALATYEHMEHRRIEMVLVFERERAARPEFHL